MFADSKKSRTFASLSKTKPSYKEVWKGGRVVDYSGLENRRAERHRGFESLPFRKESEKSCKDFSLQDFFVLFCCR